MAMTKAAFLRLALQGVKQTVNVNGMPVMVTPKGSLSDKGNCGYIQTGKAPIVLSDGTTVTAQVNGNITILGSDKWEDGADLQEVLKELQTKKDLKGV